MSAFVLDYKHCNAIISTKDLRAGRIGSFRECGIRTCFQRATRNIALWFAEFELAVISLSKL
jgi:hypothetical protein